MKLANKKHVGTISKKETPIGTPKGREDTKLCPLNVVRRQEQLPAGQ